jgi:peptidylprolyl isomerase
VTRYLSAIVVVLALSPLLGCGDSGSPSRTERRQVLLKTRPKFVRHGGPAPARLEVTALKGGSGRAARKGDHLGIIYVGFNYETGEEMYRHWALHPLPFTLGSEYLAKGIEMGLRGIRLGERRELILPPDFAYGRETVEYFVQLARLNGRESD